MFRNGVRRSSITTNTMFRTGVRRLRTAADMIALESKHGAHNYHPLPVVLDRAKGVHVWDLDGKDNVSTPSSPTFF